MRPGRSLALTARLPGRSCVISGPPCPFSAPRRLLVTTAGSRGWTRTGARAAASRPFRRRYQARTSSVAPRSSGTVRAASSWASWWRSPTRTPVCRRRSAGRGRLSRRTGCHAAGITCPVLRCSSARARSASVARPKHPPSWRLSLVPSARCRASRRAGWRRSGRWCRWGRMAARPRPGRIRRYPAPPRRG